MKRVNQRQAIGCIARGEQFEAAALSGGPNRHDTGQLPDCFRELFAHDRPSYVVYSYATPIAWVTDRGDVRIPETKYSVTTSKHQSYARQGLAWRRP